MTIETQANISLTAEDRASSIVRKLRREVDQLTTSLTKLTNIKLPTFETSGNTSVAAKAIQAATIQADAAAMAGLRQRSAFEARATRQRANDAQAGERQRKAYSSSAMADIRRQLAFAERMAKQRLAETRTVERERQRAADAAERDAAAALRRRISNDNYRFGLRAKYHRQEEAAAKARGRELAGGRRDVGRGFSQIGTGASRAYGATSSMAVFGAVAQAAVAKAVESAFTSRMKVEAAETGLRMFGSTLARPGQAAKAMSAADVAELRAAWLDEASVGAGVAPEVGIRAYTEVLKSGIDANRAREMTELVLSASAGMDMNSAETTRVLGRMATVMGGKDGVSGDRMSKIMTGMAIAASETAANPDEIVSGMNRGMSALAYGMSPEDLAAWVATGASTGIQAAKTGNFVSTLLQNGIGAKNQRGQKLKDMDTAAQMVGMGSAGGMSRQAAKDPNAFLETMFERVERLSVEKRAKFSRLMGGQEWDDEILQMKQGLDTLKKTRAAIKDERNKNFLDDNKDLKNASLTGLWARMKSRFSLLWESFGHGFSDAFSEVATWFIASGRAVNLAGLRSVGASLMSGLVGGLGFDNWTALLNRTFGQAGKLDFGRINQTVTRFAEGFGAGIRTMIDWARGFLGAVGGDKLDAKDLGKLAAGFLGLSFGLLALKPVIGLFTIATSGLTILAGGVTALNGALLAVGAGGLVGAGASILSRLGFTSFAGSAAGLGVRAAAMAGIAGLTVVGGGLLIAGLVGATALAVAVMNWDAIKDWFSKGKIEDRINNEQGGESLASRMWKYFRGGDATFQRQSYGGYNGAFDSRMTQNATYNGPGGASGGLRGFDGAQIVRAAFTAPGIGGGAIVGMGGNLGAGSSSTFPGVGGATGPRAGGGPAVPGWYGKGSGGSASSNPANSAASAAMLDAIASTESGRAGYDAVLGNGKFGTPSKPVSSMTVDEAFAFGRQVRARHGSSSALGRYQIVGTTMRAAQRALGIPGDAMFDPAMQDRMARWIARNQGLGAWEGLKSNPRAMAAARQAMAQGGAQDAPTGGAPIAGGSSAAGGDVAGLRIKGAEAVAGGASSPGIVAALKGLQADGIPGGFGRVTALNDAFHKGRRSKHNEGLAGDLTILDPRKSAEAAEAIRAKLRGAGLGDDAFRVIDEYRNPSGHATGGHLHVQFNSREAAERYAKATGAGQKAQDVAGDIVRSGQGFGPKAATAEDLTSKVPMPASRGRGAGAPGLDAGGSGFQKQGGNGGGGPQVVVHNTIHAGNQSPQEMAGHIQRHVTEAWNFRSHDLEPELT